MLPEIEIQKLKREGPEFFRKTSTEIINFVLSEKTSEKIADIAMKNGINNKEQIEGIAFRAAWVLLGKLPSGNLAITLELGVKLTQENAKKIADETNQFISSSMIKLKKKKNDLSSKKEISEKKPVNEKSKKSPSKDVYRELID